MRIKLDENLPDGLVSLLAGLGTMSTQCCLRGSQVETTVPGTHYGLLLVRLPQPGRIALLERVSTLFHDEEVDGWAGCMIVATPRKVRIRRPAIN